jgi:rhodanese-related sulfurtransferase
MTNETDRPTVMNKHAMNKLKLMIAALLLCAAGRAQAQVKEIGPHELHALLAGGGVTVIDVNEAENYSEAHVPGARRLDYDAIVQDSLPADLDSALVFYCWSSECPAAGTAAEKASGLGYRNVSCMKAGITGWQDAGLPTEP